MIAQIIYWVICAAYWIVALTLVVFAVLIIAAVVSVRVKPDVHCVCVWLIAKPGEPIEATARGVAPDRAAALRAQGYRIILAYVPLPPEFDQADAVVSARVVRDAMATMPDLE